MKSIEKSKEIFQLFDDCKKLIGEMSELDSAATKGPWYEPFETSDEDGFCEPYSYGIIMSADNDDEICTCRMPDSPDSRFIIRARTLVPELVNRIEQLLSYLLLLHKTQIELQGMTARAERAERDNQWLRDQLKALKESNDGLCLSHKNLSARLQKATGDLEDYQHEMLVIQKQWEPSECPRCHHDFSDYEPCDDGYYKRAYSLERCPYCGQLLKWNE